MADSERDKPDVPSDDQLSATAEQPEVDQSDTAQAVETAEEESPKLQLDVDIEQRSACERHITATVSAEDIQRYFDQEFSELMPNAQVPGFRPGRAPRKLVESRFRKDIAGRVKSNLLLDALEQIHDEHKLSPISEPDIDLEAIETPDEGPMTFEFDLEVRPEFDVPQWKGLKIERPTREFTDADVDRAMRNVLANRGRLVPKDDPAEPGDYVTVNLSFKLGDQVLSRAEEEVIRIRPVLSFRDGKIEQFDELMSGVKAGDTREGQATISEDAPNEKLRGQTVTGVFEVLEVKRLDLPTLDDELLQELGDFESEADLRDAILDQLNDRLKYEQRQRAREQITAALTESATWDLPPDLLRRQSRRELQRAVLELRSSGFDEDQIRAYENELRQNSMASTARALKEHFILERIAEDQEIDPSEEDIDLEIYRIAMQSNESPRRVRSRLEKSGSTDVLRNQVLERKVIDQILEHAEFTDVPFEFEPTDVEAIDEAAGGAGSDIPQAEHAEGEAAPGGRPEETPERD
jgi:trigger factor